MAKSTWPHPPTCECLACEMRNTAGMSELTRKAVLRARRAR